MKTVKEVSRITGVSVRTLHHYDAIGLLKPTAVTEAGYRLYDDAALERMQSILFFRELGYVLGAGYFAACTAHSGIDTSSPDFGASHAGDIAVFYCHGFV